MKAIFLIWRHCDFAATDANFRGSILGRSDAPSSHVNADAVAAIARAS